MTILFVHPIDGNDDTGNGSEASPYKTRLKARQSLGTGQPHQILVRRGTTEVITSTLGSFRSGLNADQPFVYGTYGPASDGPARLTAATNIGDLMYILSGEQHVLIQDWWFDGAGVVSRPFQAQCLTANTSVELRRCQFTGSATNGSFIDNKASGTYTVTVVMRDCHAEDNAGHGFHAVGAATVTYFDCSATRNGATLATGGHGFSSHAYRDSFDTGWTLVSGTIYSRSYTTVPLKVCAVQNSTYPILANAGATASPALGQYGQTGGLTYVNIGTNPNGQLITFQTSATPAITYNDCMAWGNLDNLAAIFREGHGFAADDFSQVTFNRCMSWGNEGAGYSLNMGDSNTLAQCFAWDNDRAAISIQRSSTNNINAFVAVNNDRDRYHGSELVFFASSANNVIRNSIFHALAGGEYVIYADDQSLTGNVPQNCVIYNGALTARGLNVLKDADRNVFADPRLVSVTNPRLGLKADTPCRNAGRFVPGVRGIDGRRYRGHHIGPWADIRRA